MAAIKRGVEYVFEVVDYRKVIRAFEEINRQQKKTEELQERVNDATRRLGDEIDRAGRRFGDSGRRIRDFNRGLRDSRTRFTELNSALELSKKAFNAVGKAMSVVAEPVDLATGFERQFNMIRTLSDDVTMDLRQQLLDLAATVPQTAADVTQAAYQAISGGVDPNVVADFLKPASDLARIADTELTVSVNALIAATNSFRAQGLTAAEAGDIMVKTFQKGVTTIPELSSSLGQVTQIAASAGVSFAEVGASIATITKGRGGGTSEAITQLRALIGILRNPPVRTAPILKAIGFRFSEAELQAKGFNGVLQDLANKADAANVDLGKLFRNVEATNGLLALTGPNAADFAQIMNDVRGASGSAAGALQKVAGDAKDLRDQFSATLDTLLIRVGAEMLPYVKDSLGDLASFLQDNSGQIVEAVKAVADELLPFITEGLADFLAYVTENSDQILITVKDLVRGLGAATELIAKIGSGLMAAQDVIWDITSPMDIGESLGRDLAKSLFGDSFKDEAKRAGGALSSDIEMFFIGKAEATRLGRNLALDVESVLFEDAGQARKAGREFAEAINFFFIGKAEANRYASEIIASATDLFEGFIPSAPKDKKSGTEFKEDEEARLAAKAEADRLLKKREQDQFSLERDLEMRKIALIQNDTKRRRDELNKRHAFELQDAEKAGLDTTRLIIRQEEERNDLERELAKEQTEKRRRLLSEYAKEEVEYLSEQLVLAEERAQEGQTSAFEDAMRLRIAIAETESDERLRIARELGRDTVEEERRRQRQVTKIITTEAKRREKADRAAAMAKVAGAEAVLGSVASIAKAVGASERTIAGIEGSQLVADGAVQVFKAADAFATGDYFGFVQHSAAAVLAGVAAAEKFKVAGGGGGGGSSGGASGGGGGGRGGGGRPVDPASVRGERARTEPRETVVNVNMGARPFSTRRDVEEGVLEAIDGGSRRLGRRRLNLRRLMR